MLGFRPSFKNFMIRVFCISGRFLAFFFLAFYICVFCAGIFLGGLFYFQGHENHTAEGVVGILCSLFGLVVGLIGLGLGVKGKLPGTKMVNDNPVLHFDRDGLNNDSCRVVYLRGERKKPCGSMLIPSC